MNQFSTPDVAKTPPQFVAPNTVLNPTMMPQMMAVPMGRKVHYQQPSFKYPAMPRPTYQANNKFPQQNRASNSMGTPFPNYRGAMNNRPLGFPTAFPAVPFGNTNGANPLAMTNWSNLGNNLPFLPQANNTNRKKAWGDKRNIWPDFYTDFTDTAWDETIGTPHKLGRMPGGWRFPSLSTPDPVTVSDAITNQFPPIAEEAGHLVDASKWSLFNSK
jgi:hypothetical protein